VRCCGYDELFDERLARKDAERYRRKGLRGSARRVLELARGGGLQGAEVLEIGGGVGSLSIELVRAGAAHATVLELSSGYDGAARSLLRERGVEAAAPREKFPERFTPAFMCSAYLKIYEELLAPESEK